MMRSPRVRVTIKRQRSRRADRARARCRAGGGLLGGKGPPAVFITLVWMASGHELLLVRSCVLEPLLVIGRLPLYPQCAIARQITPRISRNATLPDLIPCPAVPGPRAAAVAASAAGSRSLHSRLWASPTA